MGAYDWIQTPFNDNAYSFDFYTCSCITIVSVGKRVKKPNAKRFWGKSFTNALKMSCSWLTRKNDKLTIVYTVLLALKSPEHGLGINMGKKIKTIPKSPNKSITNRYHVLVLKKMCTIQDISNIPFMMRGNHFLVHGHKKDLPYITCIFHLLKYVQSNFV